MSTAQGYGISVLYVLMSFTLTRNIQCCDFLKRKLLHFLMANWWFIRIFWNTNILAITLGPLIFIFINYYITKINKEVKDYGLIYFSIALTGLTILSFESEKFLMYCTVAMVILGIGDPCAAIFGKKYGKKRILNNKTYIGSISFLITSFCFTMFVLAIFHSNEVLKGVVVCLVATIAELISEKGGDNLFIPISVLFTYISFESKLLMLLALCHIIFALIVSMKRNLTFDATLCSYCIGNIAGWLGGIEGIIILYGFFILAVGGETLVKIKKKNTCETLCTSKYHEQRNIYQVLANSGIALIILLLYWKNDSIMYLYTYCAIFSASLSDTMASCFGSAFGKKTVSITTFKLVDSGLSGGITLCGCISGAIASWLLPFLLLLGAQVKLNLYMVALCGILGFFGMLIDSLLGDVLQVKYKCRVCEKVIENKYCCEKEAIKIKGLQCINNNVVNLLSTILIALIGSSIFNGLIK